MNNADEQLPARMVRRECELHDEARERAIELGCEVLTMPAAAHLYGVSTANVRMAALAHPEEVAFTISYAGRDIKLLDKSATDARWGEPMGYADRLQPMRVGGTVMSLHRGLGYLVLGIETHTEYRTDERGGVLGIRHLEVAGQEENLD